MTRMLIDRPSAGEIRGKTFCEDMIRRLSVSPVSNCPLDQSLGFLRMCQAQSCGKCAPCRIGLMQMSSLLEKIFQGQATKDDLDELGELSLAIYRTADCAIGYEAGKFIEESLAAYEDEYKAHVETGICAAQFTSIPCVTGCPAHVDIPSYIALAKEERFEDGIRVIRNNNPFASVCAYICEHPCEEHCRRNIVDDAVNIRGIKKYLVENVDSCDIPQNLEATGKSIGVIGGGPSGLTAAYYLSLMGHDVTIYEQNHQLGGMLVYGIPRYRLPQESLNFDIQAILSTGITVEYGARVGETLSIDELTSSHDALYIAIGAHSFKSIGIEGEDLEGVYSAVEILHNSSGLNEPIDMQGRDVVVIGGGNVAMDATRTAKRLGAASVKCVYRRRMADMTALDEEIESTIAEDCELMTLLAPVLIEQGEEKPLVLKAQPQNPGPYANGRPKPLAAQADVIDIPCDIIIAAIGQDIESEVFAQAGFETNRGRMVCTSDTVASGKEGIFAGGDCASGPATVIRAIEAGKVAAANIDEYLGYSHVVYDHIDIPRASFSSGEQVGRVNIKERAPRERAADFSGVELPIAKEAAHQECERCLRCDHYGFQAIREGRSKTW